MYTENIDYRKSRDENIFNDFNKGCNYADIAAKYGLTITRIREIVAQKKRDIAFWKESDDDTKALYNAIYSLPLVPHSQTRLYHALRRRNINTLSDLKNCPMEKLRKARCIGIGSINILAEAGLIKGEY